MQNGVCGAACACTGVGDTGCSLSEFNVADWKNHWEDNAGGTAVIGSKKVGFFVDKECILCSVCSDAAPNNFRMSDAEDHDICFKQPENEEELSQCQEAMENCPVEAIGENGQ